MKEKENKYEYEREREYETPENDQAKEKDENNKIEDAENEENKIRNDRGVDIVSIEKKPKAEKTNTLQELDVYWKLNNKGKPMLAIKLTKGKRITVILKDPKYLKSLRGHLQQVAKLGLRKNFI